MADAATPTLRRVRVEHVMGTAVSLDLREPLISEAAIDEMFAWLEEVDARFSPFRETSEVSAVRRGVLDSGHVSGDLAEVLALADRTRDESGGAFDVWRHDPVGFDPSGLVKGWSIDRAAGILVASGAQRFCINAGGDILCRGGALPGHRWRIGLRHPHEPEHVSAVVVADSLAVATSGAYERGPHIRDPRTGAPPSELVSATVAGPTLALADAYATAIFVMGLAGLRWLEERVPEFAAYAVTTAGRAVWTARFDQLLKPALPLFEGTTGAS